MKKPRPKSRSDKNNYGTQLYKQAFKRNIATLMGESDLPLSPCLIGASNSIAIVDT